MFPPAIYLGSNYGGGHEDNGKLFQKIPCMYPYTQCLQPCSRPAPTHASAGDSWTLTGKSGMFTSHRMFNSIQKSSYPAESLQQELARCGMRILCTYLRHVIWKEIYHCFAGLLTAGAVECGRNLAECAAAAAPEADIAALRTLKKFGFDS